MNMINYIQQKVEEFRHEIYGKGDALFDRKGNNVSTQVENQFTKTLQDTWNEAMKTSRKASEKCMVEIPTYEEDGITQKDSDYWVLCLKDRPCPIHDQRNMYEIGRKDERESWEQILLGLTKGIISLKDIAKLAREEIEKRKAVLAQEDILRDKKKGLIT